MLATTFTASAVTAIAIVLLRPFAHCVGLLDRPDGRKCHVGDIPVVGGVAIFLGILAGAWFHDPVDAPQASIWLTSTVLVTLGVVDDRFGVPANVRLITHVAVAWFVVAHTGLTLGIAHGLGAPDAFVPWLDTTLTVAAAVTTMNAFNLIDGSDGLAGGLVVLASGAMLLGIHAETAIVNHDLMLIVVATLVFLGANVGAMGPRIFLGDAGSITLGHMVFWTMLCAMRSSASTVPVDQALWCVALPLFDLTCVVIHRLRTRRSPLGADRSHIHHLLQSAGLKRGAVLLVVLGIGATLAVFGTLTGAMHPALRLVAWCLAFVIYFVVRQRLHRAFSPATNHALPVRCAE